MSQPSPRYQALLVALLGLPLIASAEPDLSGPWQIQHAGQALWTKEGKAPPLLPEAKLAQQKTQALFKENKGADPSEDCLPPGIPRVLTQAWPFNIVQGRRTIGMMLEWNHLTRIIYLDRGHYPSIGPLYLGQSIGRWDGNTLVIDTNSYNDTTWLDDKALPHSDQMTTVERVRLIDGGQKLEDEITITDPKTFFEPWTARLVFAKHPGVLIREDYCLGRVGKGKTPSK